MAKRKLKINDIKKNSSQEVSHMIKKIQENERKYTIILVVFFMLLFVFIGYSTLKVNDKYFRDDISSLDAGLKTSSFSEVITLTNENVLPASKAFATVSYEFNIKNTSKKDINYQVVLEKDDEYIKKCGCQNRLFDWKNIRFSLDRESIKSFENDNMIVDEGSVKGLEGKDFNIVFWIDENAPKDLDYHYHGKLVVKEVK